PLRRALPASFRLRTVIPRRFGRSRPIDTWRVSIQTPHRPPWSFGNGQEHRRLRDRSAPPRDRHQGRSLGAGIRHRPARQPASGDAGCGLEAGPLSQWLFSTLAEAGLPVICVETRGQAGSPAAYSLRDYVAVGGLMGFGMALTESGSRCDVPPRTHEHKGWRSRTYLPG